MKLIVEDEGKQMEALWFGDPSEMEEFLTEKGSEESLSKIRIGAENDVRIAVAYHPDINEYRGMRSLQIRIIHYA